MGQVQNPHMSKHHPTVSSGSISRYHTMPKQECRLCSPYLPWHTPPEGRPVQVTLEAPGDEPHWLLLDHDRFHISGTAPLTATDQTYQLRIRAQAEPGVDSRLLVLLTITGPPNRVTSTPRLPSHWSW